MPRAEFLYEKIKKSAFNDYSPFILYYCRALEFELFHKIFLEYHNYIEGKFKDKTILFEYNKTSLSSKAIKEIESGIIQGFKRGVLNNSPKYTLGDMRLLLNLLPSENKTKGSNRFQTLLALQELSLFINNKIGRSDALKLFRFLNCPCPKPKVWDAGTANYIIILLSSIQFIYIRCN